MEYLAGMFSAFAGIIAVFSAAHFLGRKRKADERVWMEHQREANVLAGRRALALERIADAMEKKA